MNDKPDLKSLHGSDYVQRFETEQLPQRLERLIGHIEMTKEMTACDFGCGNGMLMPYVCPRVSSYVGIDFSEDFISAARNNARQHGFKNAEFVCGDIKEFCSEHTKAFDIGFAMDVSEHVPDEEWLEILQSIHASLKPSGSLYLHTPNARFIIEIMKEKNFILKQFPEHVAVRDAKSNIELLQRAGFTRIVLESLPHYNILRYLHPLSHLPLIGAFFEARLFIRATT